MDYSIRDDDGDIVITILPGTAEETKIVIERDPDGASITVDDVAFDPQTGELTVSLSDGGVERFDVAFLIPPRPGG